MAEKKSFILYHSYMETFSELTDEEAGQLIKAIFNHEVHGETIDMDRIVKMAYLPIKSNLERDKAEYENVCEKRKAAGRLGGRPRKQETEEIVPAEKTKSFFSKAKKPDNDDGDENVNETDIDIVNVNAVVNEKSADARDIHTNNVNSRIFGQYVRLTEEQYCLLCNEYGEATVRDYINRVDSYIENSGSRPYSNHYTTLSQWLKKDSAENSRKSQKLSAEHSYDLSKLVAHAMENTPKLTV